MPPKTPHVLIIGAGIGGLTLAQCLRKQGISFEVFERDDSPTARGQGYAIGLYNLDTLFGDSLPTDLPPFSTTQHLQPLPLPSQAIYHAPGGKLFHVTDSPSTPCIRANRLRLRTLLSTGLTIRFGKAATWIEETPSSVTVHFADGSSATGDVVVGADGCHSAVRPHVLGRPNEEVLRQWPADIVCGEVQLSGEDMEGQLRLGHSCALAIRPDGILFTGLNRVTVDEETGETTGDYYWVLSVLDTEGVAKGTGVPDRWTGGMSAAEKLAWVKGRVEDLDETLRLTVERTGPEGIAEYSAWWDADIPELPPVNRVVLIGDAAHPMTPNRGEGGIHAITGAVRLSKVLAGADVSEFAAMKTKLDECQKDIIKDGHDCIVATRADVAEVRAGKATPKAWGHYSELLKELPPLPIGLTKK